MRESLPVTSAMIHADELLIDRGWVISYNQLYNMVLLHMPLPERRLYYTMKKLLHILPVSLSALLV